MKKMIILIFILNSCVLDKISELAVVKNASNKKIIVKFQSKDFVDDKSLFYGSNFIVNPHSTKTLKTTAFKFDTINFFFFSYDSVYKKIDQGESKGIANHSFLKKISISSEDLKNNDTLIYEANE